MTSDAPANFPDALFLDRDGTLIKWVDYLSDPELVELVPGVGECLVRAKELGCRLFVHTNQSGVGRGYFGMEAVEAVNARMCELLGVGADFFDAWCVATDHPSAVAADSYRKPRPRFELEMVAKYGLDKARCYMVGDSLSDVETGLNAGIVPVLVASEQGFEGRVPSGALQYGSVSEFWGAVEKGAI